MSKAALKNVALNLSEIFQEKTYRHVISLGKGEEENLLHIAIERHKDGHDDDAYYFYGIENQHVNKHGTTDPQSKSHIVNEDNSLLIEHLDFSNLQHDITADQFGRYGPYTKEELEAMIAFFDASQNHYIEDDTTVDGASQETIAKTDATSENLKTVLNIGTPDPIAEHPDIGQLSFWSYQTDDGEGAPLQIGTYLHDGKYHIYEASHSEGKSAIAADGRLATILANVGISPIAGMVSAATEKQAKTLLSYIKYRCKIDPLLNDGQDVSSLSAEQSDIMRAYERIERDIIKAFKAQNYPNQKGYAPTLSPTH